MSNYSARVDFGGYAEWELTERELAELQKHKPDCHYAIWLLSDDRSYHGVCNCGASADGD